MSLQVAEAENTETQKSQGEGRPKQGHNRDPGPLAESLDGILSYWFWVAICWQDFFNAASSINVQRENEYLLKTVTGTGNFLDQISVTLITERTLLEFHSKFKEKNII